MVPLGAKEPLGQPHRPEVRPRFMGYTRRQLCYIVAKSLTGSGTKGYDNALPLGSCLEAVLRAPRKSFFDMEGDI